MREEFVFVLILFEISCNLMSSNDKLFPQNYIQTNKLRLSTTKTKILLLQISAFEFYAINANISWVYSVGRGIDKLFVFKNIFQQPLTLLPPSPQKKQTNNIRREGSTLKYDNFPIKSIKLVRIQWLKEFSVEFTR